METKNCFAAVAQAAVFVAVVLTETTKRKRIKTKKV